VPFPTCANADAGALGRNLRSVLTNQFMKP
jgi:hypothetical protein